ncbi:unnamed protein product [Prorocentrum cordatum]|uniref:S1 motif domain-containing protein n=1 Tax=Prorocentrum cordatum TaxID=2364126 RepID=A0ABN9XQJ2_9DINO|nr:unnamed protein product [Polarella glacialis]
MAVEVDSEGVFHECTVEEVSSDWKYCAVKYTDGGEVEEDVDIRGRLRRPRPPWIGAGMRVEVEYEGDYYAGKVTKVSRDKSTCSVAYDAEDEEDEDDIDVRTRVRPERVKLDSLKKGDKIVGRVTKVLDFGAFVDIGAVKEGLLHVSVLRSRLDESPADVVQIGEEITVYVDRVSDDPVYGVKRVSLVLEKPQVYDANRPRYCPDVSPWIGVDRRQWLTGKVVNIEQGLGLFVEVEHPTEGKVIKGMVHITKIANEFVEDIFDYADFGDEVKVRVDYVDARLQRLGLTMLE